MLPRLCCENSAEKKEKDDRAIRSYENRMKIAVGGLNPGGNFRYLLSTAQQQVVDSTEVPPFPSFHKFPPVYFAVQNEYAPRHTEVRTRARRKTETCRARLDFCAETSPDSRKGPLNLNEKLLNSPGWSR